MNIDDLRAIRATLVWTMEDRFFAPHWQFAYGDGIRAVRHTINELDAILPVVTDEEALAALA
jgi:hypothetical protein